jgi:hypothetical protein
MNEGWLARRSFSEAGRLEQKLESPGQRKVLRHRLESWVKKLET